jgi:uncharacterized membrane protein
MQHRLMRTSWILIIFPVMTAAVWAQSVWAQTEGEDVSVSPLSEEGKLVQFERDIAPILKKHCLECHGPEDAKNDFRVDDSEIFLEYVEPEDADSSSLYVDYLTVDDIDMLMPPTTHGGPLSASDLALIRVWINEGAHWPEDFEFVTDSDEPTEAAAPVTADSNSFSNRAWRAQGYLHPATIHFPIALFLLGGGFVVLGWKWPTIGTQIPLACLLLGSVTAVASSMMGWAFAPEQGYGIGWDLFDWEREIDVHRWSGLIVTVFSILLAIIALLSLWKDSERLTKAWKVGLLVCAGMVGAVGHQGGELSYGADFYPRAWRILTGSPDQPEKPAIEKPADAAEGESVEG